MSTAQTVALVLPAVVEALGLAVTALQSVKDDDTDEQALMKLDAQLANTDQALADLRAVIASKRAEQAQTP